MTSIPKPQKRIIDKEVGYEKCRAERYCRACRNPWSDRHHLVPRSLGGDDLDANIVPLCNPCNLDFHLSPKGRETVGAAVRKTLSDDELGYIVSKKSWAFLDRYYPEVDADTGA